MVEDQMRLTLYHCLGRIKLLSIGPNLLASQPRDKLIKRLKEEKDCQSIMTRPEVSVRSISHLLLERGRPEGCISTGSDPSA